MRQYINYRNLFDSKLRKSIVVGFRVFFVDSRKKKFISVKVSFRHINNFIIKGGSIEVDEYCDENSIQRDISKFRAKSVENEEAIHCIMTIKGISNKQKQLFLREFYPMIDIDRVKIRYCLFDDLTDYCIKEKTVEKSAYAL